MQKTAQKRSILNKLREVTNVSGIAAEKFFNPQFKAVMETIRQKDDQIRTFVVGKKLGDAEEMPTAPALKDILKAAKSNLNRREFMVCATDLGLFHEQVNKIVLEIQSIDHKVDEVHHEFLFDKLTPEQQEQLVGFKTKFAKKQLSLHKEAGIMDFFHNIGTTRGRALAAWEKRYSNEVSKFKVGLTTLLSKSEHMQATIIEALSDMATARSVRNVDDYMKGSGKIIKVFASYENGKGGFKEFYNMVLKPYIEKMEGYKTRRESEGLFTDKGVKDHGNDDGIVDLSPPKASEFPKVPLGPNLPPTGYKSEDEMVDALKGKSEDNQSDYLANLPSISPSQQAKPQTQLNAPSVNPIAHKSNYLANLPPIFPSDYLANLPSGSPLQTKPSDDDNTPPDTVRNPGIPVHTHRKFYSSLESMSQESPAILALYIKKYANSIRTSDPKFAVNLLKMASDIGTAEVNELKNGLITLLLKSEHIQDTIVDILREITSEQIARRKIEPSTNLTSKYYKFVMEVIRKKDDQIKTFVFGKKIGNAEQTPTAPSLKDILKSAKLNFNRKEFMACATDLTVFNDQIKKIVIETQSIDNKIYDNESTIDQQDKLFYIDNYIKGAENIIKAFISYENGKGGFKEFTNVVLKNYMYKEKGKGVTDLSPTTVRSPNTLKSNENDKSRYRNYDKIPATLRSNESDKVPATIRNNESDKIPATIRSNENESDKIPATLRSPGISVNTHRKFYSSLESMSQESPAILALYIKKYANSIRTSDPKISVNLFQISKRIGS